ncbi:hypothetical protein OS493_038873 [Desmophyllum pertusum]|uniref:Uncharacterized protein n=1 Tax=Desmophyllum pertusum TaxID=174260 RepID=A0A9W9ZUX0_9CNID|nr:hypothetical protein OS493_038873 [Desmophyllum pertusum]
MIGSNEVKPLLVSNSSFDLSSWLMKPYTQTPNISTSQNNFNGALSSAREKITQAFGLVEGPLEMSVGTLKEDTLRVPTTVIACLCFCTICVLTLGMNHPLSLFSFKMMWTLTTKTALTGQQWMKCLLFDLFQAANQITAASSKCHNVHINNYYSGPTNNDIKAHLLKIENQLADVQKKIDAMTGNKTSLDDVDFDDKDCIDWPAMDENGKQLRETIRNYLDTYGY